MRVLLAVSVLIITFLQPGATSREIHAPKQAVVLGVAATISLCRKSRTSPITTWAIAGGLKLTLTVPRRVYPRNALARVEVSIQNVSKHDVGYWTPGISPPGFASPQAEVLDGHGRVVFPPAMPYMPPLPGPPPILQPLHPGQLISVSEYIVVRGARIRASQRFVPRLPRDMVPAAETITTQLIGVRLAAELPPKLVLHQSAEGPTVDVVRPSNVSGTPLVLTYADCGALVNINYSFDLDPFGAPPNAWVLSGECVPCADRLAEPSGGRDRLLYPYPTGRAQ